MSITPLSIVLGVFKPALKNKFEFKEIHKVTFMANKIADTLRLEGWGCEKNDINPKFKQMQELKLSENSEFVGLFMKQISSKIKAKEVTAANITIDFEKSEATSEVFYISEEGKKLKQNISTII